MRRNPVRSEISIHAPTGGATIFCALPRVEKTYFNPRSHGGSDMSCPVCLLLDSDFNPRSHGGSDCMVVDLFSASQVFQSTLPRGERLISPVNTVLGMSFQSTLPRGERPCTEALISFRDFYFNPRAHGGSDDISIVSFIPSEDFNPRSHGGSD